jgi:NitT/TauT family transport system permease protein
MEGVKNLVGVEPAATSIPKGATGLHHALRAILLPLIAVVASLVLWQAAVRLFAISPTILPAPTEVYRALIQTFPLLMDNAVQTGSEAVLGLILASVLGLAIGIALAFSEPLRTAMYPNMVFFQLIPKVALAPLFIVWLGIGTSSRLAFTVFITFFPIAISTQIGLMLVDPNYVRLCRGLTASEWQTFLHIRMPFAMPSIFTGLKVGVTMAFVGVIVGEFITSQAGLGYLILFAMARVETAVIFAAITVLCVIGLAVYGAVALLERVVRRFWGIPW